MSKVLYSATVSLDGYIAGPGGDMSWLRPHLQPNPPIEQLQRDIGALLVGGRTHRGDDPHLGTEQQGAFEGTWDGPVFVVTRQPPSNDGGVHFVERPEAGLEAAKAAAAGRYVNVLGAELARGQVRSHRRRHGACRRGEPAQGAARREVELRPLVGVAAGC